MNCRGKANRAVFDVVICALAADHDFLQNLELSLDPDSTDLQRSSDVTLSWSSKMFIVFLHRSHSALHPKALLSETILLESIVPLACGCTEGLWL